MDKAEHLDAFERARLARAEKTIRKGLKTFVAVGTALLDIRDNRLYRAEFESFETYCRARWGLSATHGNRLIQAAEVVQAVAPIGAVPHTESQARELAPLLGSPGVMRRAWATVVRRTGGKPTAEDVHDVVRETIRTPAGPGATPEAPDRAGGGAPADVRGEARTAGDTPTNDPPAPARAGEGGGAAGPDRDAQPGRSASGAPADATGRPRPGAPTGPRPEPQPASPRDAGPESGGTGAPSSSSQVEGAAASPSARPVAEGGAAWPEPLLTGAEVHDALTDESSPLFLPDFGCRLALVHVTQGARHDRAVVAAFRQTLGVAS